MRGLLRMFFYDRVVHDWMPNARGIWNRLFFLTLGAGAILVAALLIYNGSQDEIWKMEAMRAVETEWVTGMQVQGKQISDRDREKVAQLLGLAEHYRTSEGQSNKVGGRLQLVLSGKNRKMTLLVFENGDMLSYGSKELITNWYHGDAKLYTLLWQILDAQAAPGA